MTYTPVPEKATAGIHYFAEGWHLVSELWIKRYVFLLLLGNMMLMGFTFWWLFS
jgi:CysZ protein